MQAEILSGSLTLNVKWVHPNYGSIGNLLDFASRKNQKRGFLFVSKILGKHIPVKPSIMRDSYNTLANEISTKHSKTLVVGMAETAIGLGAGVADSFATNNRDIQVYFQSTTRHHIDSPKWFQIVEEHCHAPSHIVYEPKKAFKNSIINSEHLVLIDDEISTGRTLLQLLCRYIDKLTSVRAVEIISLVSWLDEAKETWFLEEVKKYCTSSFKPFPTIKFIALAKGSFEFVKNPEFKVDLPPNTDSHLETRICDSETGRQGMKMPYKHQLENIESYQDFDKPITVVGYCENVFIPFLKAEAIENIGKSHVLFQSCTRSPIIADGKVIRSVNVIDVNRKDQPKSEHYIYNLDPIQRHIIVEK